MSDIGIRLDGLILLAALLLGGILWSVAAVIAAVLALVRSRPRRWKLARRAGALAVAAFCLSAAFAIWWDKHGTNASEPDWVDQLTYPWAALFLAGCWWLARAR